MFFAQLESLCTGKGTTPSTVARELGFSMGSVSHWRKGNCPGGDIVVKFADYFGVTTDRLLKGEENKSQSQLRQTQIMKTASEIAITIKKKAKDRGVKTGKLLEECGLNINFINQMMKTGSMPSVENLYRIASYLNLSLEYLLTGEEKNSQSQMWLEQIPKEDVVMDRRNYKEIAAKLDALMKDPNFKPWTQQLKEGFEVLDVLPDDNANFMPLKEAYNMLMDVYAADAYFTNRESGKSIAKPLTTNSEENDADEVSTAFLTGLAEKHGVSCDTPEMKNFIDSIVYFVSGDTKPK